MSRRKVPSAPIKRKSSLSPSHLDHKSIIKTASESGVKTLEVTLDGLKADFVSQSKLFEWLGQHRAFSLFILPLLIFTLGVCAHKYFPGIWRFLRWVWTDVIW